MTGQGLLKSHLRQPSFAASRWLLWQRLKWLRVLLVIAGCGTVAPASAAQPMLVVTEQWPPFNYTDQHGQVVGRYTDAVRAILADAAIPYRIEVFPWARSFDLAKSKANVLIYTIFRNNEREPLFHWFCPLTTATPVYFLRLTQRQDIDVRNVVDAKRYRTGVVRDDHGHQYLQEQGFVEGVDFDVSADEETNLRKLLGGRVDLILQNDEAVRFRLAELGELGDKITVLAPIVQDIKHTSFMAVSKHSDPVLVARLRAAHARYLLQNNIMPVD